MRVLFFGLGRIGLPQSLVFADAGHQVFGYDIDATLVAALTRKLTPFHEPGMEALLQKHSGKRFIPCDDWQAVVGDVDAIIFTLGTKAPDATTCLRETEGDLKAIESILDELFAKSQPKRGLLVVFRTTLFLGSTAKLKAYVENRYEIKEGDDFHLSFVPERLMEGRAVSEERGLPKIVGAFSDAGFEAVRKLFEPVGGRVIRVSDPTTAEFCKLMDNSYRSTIFAFANEAAMWAARRGVDAVEVIDAINADYERNHIPSPGFVSGYCLGKDPYIFEYGFGETAQDRGFQSLWYYGRRTNDAMIQYTTTEVREFLSRQQKSLQESRVAILGLSFKEDVDDFRMSHALDLIKSFVAAGVGSIHGYDPALDQNKYTLIPWHLRRPSDTYSNELTPELLKGADAVVIAHRHASLREVAKSDLPELLRETRSPLLVFDAWNIWRNARRVHGVEYVALGLANGDDR
jgi:nucleotide sugar dehydrogenase